MAVTQRSLAGDAAGRESPWVIDECSFGMPMDGCQASDGPPVCHWEVRVDLCAS
jgi:hypothetical protein